MTCDLPTNMLFGRLKVRSGDSTPLSLTVDFCNGDLSWTVNEPKEATYNRGTPRGFLPTRRETQKITFSAQFVNEVLYRTMLNGVWAAQAEAITGLTADANNADEPLAYAYEQGSLAPASGETGIDTALAAGATPSSTGEYAEPIGVVDASTGVTRAAATADFYPPAADTDVNVTYDAVGKSTVGAYDATCPSPVFHFEILFEKLNPADQSQVLKTYQWTQCVLDQASYQEGDKDQVSFSVQALDRFPVITDGAVS